jgi:hypothetical protein
MKKRQQTFRANNSGQLLIVAALAIAILISSTTIYIYELGNETNNEDHSSISDFVLALKQGTRNAMISSLANVSNGGEKTVLTANLNRLSQVFGSINSLGICQLTFTPLNDSGYDSGTWLSWNISDMGVSSVYADFTLGVFGMAMNATLSYAVNVTSTIAINGYYTRLSGDEKLVNLTYNVYNEGTPALAKSVTFFYEAFGSWLPVAPLDYLSTVDYGNGTYRISFTVATPSSAVQVSAHVHDSRDILVQANTTCYET